MKSSISTAVVLAACFLAFLLSAQSIKADHNSLAAIDEAVNGWQSYCMLPASAETAKTGSINPIRVTRLAVASPHSHSMHLFMIGDELRLWDMAPGKQWEWKDKRTTQWNFDGQEFTEIDPIKCPPFRAYGYDFTQQSGIVSACRKDQPCRSALILESTWTYAFAAAKGGVLAISNYGDALLFRDGRWCRMSMQRDVYRCDGHQRILTEPRKIQFYSSVQYRGRTLVGEWPTGRLYEFDGTELRPIDNQPPFVSAEPVGYEAQSMAEYCGDLYVGYWPTGEIWRLDGNSNEWSKAAALFSPPHDTKTFIPYQDRQKTAPLAAFYGRRVTALVPFEGSLFASTSNLRDWDTEYTSAILTEQEADQYGAIYKLDREGCGIE